MGENAAVLVQGHGEHKAVAGRELVVGIASTIAWGGRGETGELAADAGVGRFAGDTSTTVVVVFVVVVVAAASRIA